MQPDPPRNHPSPCWLHRSSRIVRRDRRCHEHSKTGRGTRDAARRDKPIGIVVPGQTQTQIAPPALRPEWLILVRSLHRIRESSRTDHLTRSIRIAGP
jgi:hypothetical protein